jgi:hypothetical protein
MDFIVNMKTFCWLFHYKLFLQHPSASKEAKNGARGAIINFCGSITDAWLCKKVRSMKFLKIHYSNPLTYIYLFFSTNKLPHFNDLRPYEMNIRDTKNFYERIFEVIVEYELIDTTWQVTLLMIIIVR